MLTGRLGRHYGIVDDAGGGAGGGGGGGKDGAGAPNPDDGGAGGKDGAGASNPDDGGAGDPKPFLGDPPKPFSFYTSKIPGLCKEASLLH